MPLIYTGTLGLLSDVSLVSSPRSSCFSTEDDTTPGSSTSTIPGPGAFTGKAIKALGTITLRGFGRLVMARHLAVIAHSFPHTDDEASRIQNISGVYDDLLEFSRPGMYNNDINAKALTLILSQIGAGQTRYLIRALSRWHRVELHILLLSIMMQLAHLWNSSLRGVFSSPLSHSYTNALDLRDSPALRLVLFLSRVIRIGAWTCKAVLDVGFLEALMSLNDYYRFRAVSLSIGDREGYNLYLACNASLLDATGYLEHRSFVAKHPISSAWPVSRKKFDIYAFKTRRQALLLGQDADVPFDDRSPFYSISLREVCFRPCISSIPAEELLCSLTFQVTHDQALRVFLSRSSHQQKVDLLSKLFVCLSETMVSSMSLDGTGHDLWWRYQFSFSLHFIAVIARSDSANRIALVEAGAFDYLINSLQIMMPDAYISAKEFIREYELPTSSPTSGRRPSNPGIQPSIFSAISALVEEPV